MIELRAVSFRYDAGHELISDLDLAVPEGELLLVSGPTGSGKSTVLAMMAGLVPRFSGGTLTGQVLLEGRDVTAEAPRARAHLVGYVGQDPAAGFVTDTVEEELAYGMEQLGLPQATMRRRVEETLDLLGIADLRSRDLRTLSGGQQQRVSIGSVLAMHPKVLVLDEPTSALDPTAAEDVLATLTRLVHDLGLSVILAEHRLERVIPFADRICLLGGAVPLLGPAIDVLTRSAVAPPIIELARASGWSPLPLTVRDARRHARELRSKLLPPSPEPDQATAPDALACSGLTVVHGTTVAVREVSLGFPAGSITAVMGRNGSGKSSLLWALQGTGERRGGRVRAGGSDPATLDPAGRRAAVGLVPQSASDLLYLESVADECAAADAGSHAPSGTCASLLGRLVPGIDPASHPRDLSEGQRLALALAIVLSAAPPVLLLDEPTRGLDYAAKRALTEILQAQGALGRTVVVATHDVEFVALVAERVVVLAEGEVVSSGPVRRVVAESPGFAPQVTKILGAPWLRVDEVVDALAAGVEQ